LITLLGGYARAKSAPAIVMVTHHVEEIPSGFTHALLMKNGAITAAGPIDEVLNPANLSLTFGLELSLEKSNDRYVARAV